MKHQVLFSLKNNEIFLLMLSAAVVIGALRVNRKLWTEAVPGGGNYEIFLLNLIWNIVMRIRAILHVTEISEFITNGATYIYISCTSFFCSRRNSSRKIKNAGCLHAIRF